LSKPFAILESHVMRWRCRQSLCVLNHHPIKETLMLLDSSLGALINGEH